MSLDQRVFAWRGHYPNPRAGSGSLAGLRLGVKDLFHIAGLPTAAGNPDWLASHALPEHSSPVVTQLLSAGAELIGKTQTDELAYSLNGLNIHYGAPINPRSPERLPGGSSSGSAVAVAAGDIDIGLGTDTGGSIRVPASYNGLFGIRTSHGLISSEQMVPLAPLFDTVGWLTRDAKTLAQVGEVLLPDNLSRNFEPGSLRIALLLPLQNGALWTPAHKAWLKEQPMLQGFKSQGCKSVILNSDWLTRASQCFRTLQGRSIWQTHGEWISQNQPRFAPDIHARFQWCATLTAADQTAAEIERASLQADIDSWFADVDLILLPTTPGAAPLLGADASWMDAYRSQLMGLTAPAGLAGLPQVHLPVLMDQGAPCGVSLLGKRGSDKALLQLAIDLCADNLCGAHS
jgi:aspartyl-tRNA(Asn)/glutamyl-tRNA(Gln) amidotransferase subunit A